MTIRLAQLPQSLARSIAPVYLLAGAEPLLVQEGREMVIAAAREQGYTERELLVADRKFSWEGDLGAAGAPSLFAQRKVIDLRLASGKPGRDGAAALTAWAENPDPDTVLVLSFGGWDSASRNAKWAKVLDKAGVVVEIWPLKPEELPAWISQRMKAAGLSADRDAVAMLSELVEGNLLAAQQEIDKLALINRDRMLTAGDIEQAVASNAQFSGFRLAECALRGDSATCLRVAAGLLRNHVAIQPVSAALYSELALARALIEVREDGGDERTFFSRARIWPQRQGPMKMAAQRLSTADMDRVFHLLTTIDLQGKGRAPGDPWRTLDALLLFLCDPRRQLVPVEA
ncbi:MAG: DNA polymerase III subunit delta [Xanthomonadales bacterium]|nr:DNA polymerase III subunit delta [Xanthomonadales bacterium]